MYAYTRTPRIYSGGEAFRIENFVRPYAVNPTAEPAAETLFVFPFDHDTVPAEVATREIAAALGALQPRILLFLRNIERLRTGGPGAADSMVERSVSRWARGVPAGDGVPGRAAGGVAHLAASGRGPPGAAGRGRVALVGGRVAAVGASPLTAFFPTEKETFLGFLIQGPYRTTPARDNIPGDDPSNQALVRQTAALLTDVLPELRDEGLLTADALQALPLDAARFPAGSMFRPLFDAAGDALTAEALIPMAGGGYGVAVDLLLAGSPEVLGLLDPGQLGVLCGAGRPVWFADAAISERSTPALWRYLRDEIGVDEITPEAVVTRLTEEFLAEQDDLWITRFYRFLAGHPSLWPAAGDKPVIRLEDGRQVAPFDGQGRPAVYLPGPAPSSLPTVKRVVADSPAARAFLTALQLTVPDVVAEVLQMVLPRYDGRWTSRRSIRSSTTPTWNGWHGPWTRRRAGGGPNCSRAWPPRRSSSARTPPPASRRCCRHRGCTSAPRTWRPTSRETLTRGSPATDTGRGWSSCARWASGRRWRSAPAPPTWPDT